MPSSNEPDQDAPGICLFYLFVILVTVPLLIGGMPNYDPSGCATTISGIYAAISIFIIVVCVVGYIGFYLRDTSIIWLYLVSGFLLIGVMLFVIVFAFVVSYKGAGEAVPGSGILEYKLGDYSNWLQKRVDNENWAKISACLVHTKACQSLQLTNNYETYARFYARNNLSSIESGCCKPPMECNFQYVSPTVWTINTTVSNLTNSDCMTWSNDGSSLCHDTECMKRSYNVSSLCYNCQSCKAGVVAELQFDSRVMAGVIIFYLIFVVMLYLGACWTFWNDQRPSKTHRQEGKEKPKGGKSKGGYIMLIPQ